MWLLPSLSEVATVPTTDSPQWGSSVDKNRLWVCCLLAPFLSMLWAGKALRYVLLSSGFCPGSWEPEPRRVMGALLPAMHGLDRKASSAGPELGMQLDSRMHA